MIRVQNPTPGTWTLISDTATLKRVNVVGQLQILLEQSHQNIKVGQRSYIDVQLANEQSDLLSAEQRQGYNLKVVMDQGGKEVFKQQQAFVADTKTRMNLPALDQPGMYNLTISVVNGQLIRTINRSLRVHPIVAIQQNTTSVPVAEEVIVVSETSSNTASQTEELVVSNETASLELQALMEEQATVVVAAEIAEPETTTSQVETTQSNYWRWLIGGGAGLVLLLLLVMLRRTYKSPK